MLDLCFQNVYLICLKNYRLEGFEQEACIFSYLGYISCQWMSKNTATSGTDYYSGSSRGCSRQPKLVLLIKNSLKKLETKN